MKNRKNWSRLSALLLTILLAACTLPDSVLAGDAPHTHNWGSWEVTKEPTALTAGSEIGRCDSCGSGWMRFIYPDGTLFVGMKDQSVKDAQELLNAAGYSCGEANGTFDSNMQNAVLKYQADKGFIQDGNFYPGYYELLASAAPPTPSYNSAIEIKLVSKPDSFSEVGETVNIIFNVKNTGDVTTSVNGIRFDDADDNFMTVDYDCEPENESWSWLEPGCDVNFTVKAKTVQADADAGMLYFKIRRIASPLLYPTGDPVRPGYRPDNLPDSFSYATGKEAWSNTIEISVPYVANTTPPTVIYQLIEGDGQTVTKGDTAKFVSDAPFSKFDKVEMDGNVVDASNYTAVEGSTSVTLKADYIKSLSAGIHSITIASTDGSASGRFTVADSKDDSSNPDDRKEPTDTDKDKTTDDKTDKDKTSKNDKNTKNSKTTSNTKSKSPATADKTDSMTWTGLLLISVLVIAGCITAMKRRKMMK